MILIFISLPKTSDHLDVFDVRIYLFCTGLTGGVLSHGSLNIQSATAYNPLLGDDVRTSSIAQLRMKAKEHSASMGNN